MVDIFAIIYRSDRISRFPSVCIVKELVIKLEILEDCKDCTVQQIEIYLLQAHRVNTLRPCKIYLVKAECCC